MNGQRVAMLGTGLIGDFYTMTLHGRRSRDRVEVVYSRSVERGAAFAERWDVAARHDEHRGRRAATPTSTPSSSVCPTTCTRRPSPRPPRPASPCCARSRSARTADEAKRILDLVESAGVFGGYLEDLVYTPKTIKAVAAVRHRRHRRRHVGAQPRDPPGSAQRLVLGRRPGRRRVHRRPRLPLHRDHPRLRRQGQPAGAGDVLERHAGAPDRGRGQRHRPHRVRERGDRPVRGQLDVPRRHGPARRGRRHRGDDLDQPLPAHRLRDVLQR